MKAIVFLISFLELLYVASPNLQAKNEKTLSYLAGIHSDVELTSMVEATYSKLRGAIAETTAEEFSVLISKCFIEFFPDEFDRSNVDKFSQLKVWWARALENGIDYTLLDESLQLPLAYQLLYGKDVVDRIDKIRLFAKYGGFSISHLEHFEAISINDTNLHTAFKYLEEYRQKDEEIVLFLLEIIFNDHIRNDYFLDELEINLSRSYAINYLKQNHCSLIVHFLESMGPVPALRLVNIIFESKIEVVHSFVEAGTQIKIPVGCTLLDKVLLLMENMENIINKENDKVYFGSKDSDKTLEHFSAHFLSEDIFTQENFSYLKKLRLQQPFLLEKIQWDAFEKFVKIGMVRNQILSFLGKGFLSQIILSENSEHFEEFVKYLRRSSLRLRLIELSRGMEHLFLTANNENLLVKAAKNRTYEILSNLVFLLGDEMLKHDLHGNTTLHHALLDRPELPQTYETSESEKKTEKILRLYLFSERLDHDSLIKTLVEKNVNGETCLSIAARKGLYRCFETIRNYLLAMGVFNQNDHIALEELNFLLLKGMRARTAFYPIEAIERQKDVLEGMINSYYSLECFDQTNEKHQEFMNLLISELEEYLDKDSAPNDFSQRKYRKAFKMIRKRLERGIKSRAFIRAPLSIQMSYYDRPFRLLIKRIIADFPEGVLSSDKILGFIIDEGYNLPHSLKAQIESIIQEEYVTAEKKAKVSGRDTWKNQAKWLSWIYHNPK